MTRFVKINRPLRFGEVVAYVTSAPSEYLLDPEKNEDRNVFLTEKGGRNTVLQVSTVGGDKEIEIAEWLDATLRKQFRLVEE